MMDGTFVEAIVEQARKPEIVSSRVFAPAEWTERRPHIATAGTLTIGTLTGLVDYLKANVDTLAASDLIVHVLSPVAVHVLSKLGEEATDFRRHTYLTATTGMVQGTPYPFGQWLDRETFIIALQTGFVPSAPRDEALALATSVRENQVRETADDGVAQRVTASRGVAFVGDVRVPNPITLRPFRTFREVEQPASLFVFRLREGKEAPACALFEADGGAWKLEAVRSIAAYLTAELGTGYAVIG